MLFRGAGYAAMSAAMRTTVASRMMLPAAMPQLATSMKWESTALGEIPSATGAPKIELYDLRDDPALGSLFRATFQEGDKQRNLQSRVILTVFPQLGPRKYDPSDPTPQFDVARRASVRLLPSEAGAICAVMEGRIAETSMKNNGFHINVARSHDGIVLKGEVFRDGGHTKIPFVATVATGNLLSFFRFMESCITESFGFKYVSARQLFLSMRDARRQSASSSTDKKDQSSSTGGSSNNNASGDGRRNFNNGGRRFFRGNNNRQFPRRNFNNRRNNSNNATPAAATPAAAPAAPAS